LPTHPAQCRLGMMPARGHQPGRQIGLPAEGDSRWDAIWQLILQAEQLPAQERAAFVRSAETDSFIIRQAEAHEPTREVRCAHAVRQEVPEAGVDTTP